MKLIRNGTRGTRAPAKGTDTGTTNQKASYLKARVSWLISVNTADWEIG